MAGLIEEGMDPNAGPPPEAMEQPGAEPQELAAGQADGDEEITPEMEAAYDKFMTAVQAILYQDGGAADTFAEQMAASQDIAQTLAGIAYDIVVTVDDKSGGMLPAELIGTAAYDVLGELAEVAKAAEVPVSGKDIVGAAKAMFSRYLKENGANDEDIQHMMGGIDDQAAGNAIDQGLGAEQPAEMEGV